MKNVAKIVGLLAVVALVVTANVQAGDSGNTNNTVSIGATAWLQAGSVTVNGVTTTPAPVQLKINNKWLISRLCYNYEVSVPANGQLKYDYSNDNFFITTNGVTYLTDTNNILYWDYDAPSGLSWGKDNAKNLSYNDNYQSYAYLWFDDDSYAATADFGFYGTLSENYSGSATNKLGVQSWSYSADMVNGTGEGTIDGTNVVMQSGSTWHLSGSGKYNAAP